MTLLHDAYDVLRRCNLVRNHVTFSTAYLNKGARYFDHLICSGRQPGTDALFSLHVRCKAVGEAYLACPVAAERGRELLAMAARAWDEMERRSCSLLSRHRSRLAPTRALHSPAALVRAPALSTLPKGCPAGS
ncbi:DUF6626 family protein [Muricoccus pecuniae]|uniref:DUF6626 family protein n=1 Tax=Muricoccus pecuniae TaxID=693023 RepID=UPI0035E43E8C